MSPPGRPKGEYRSAQHAGLPVRPPGRPKGEYRSAQHEGSPVTVAVVFAYHDVGARGLRVLLAHGIDVRLVVTHDDDPAETLWFERVADVARDYGVPAIAPTDPNVADVVARVAACAPDFLFSFYYRRMLGAELLALPRRGALNLHGSLLPHYRGRAPVNWAVLHGERHTGATLHYMEAKPDAGDIVGQQAVPILPDDTARDVLAKVTVAAEIVLDAALPRLVAGTAPRIAQDLSRGSYFGGRTAEEGRIDWMQSATRIHDLVRAVAPPYPGALTTIGGRPAHILATRVLDSATPPTAPAITLDGGRIVARCGGGGTLALYSLEIDGTPVDPALWAARHGTAPVTPGT
jgi:methionyl-tRNA formyltransferase